MNIHLIKIKDTNTSNEVLSVEIIEKMKITFDESPFQLRVEKIQPKMDCAKNEIITFFKDREEVEGIKFGVSTVDTDMYKINTPIAEVETSNASYTVIFDHLSLVNGNLIYPVHQFGNYVEKRPLLANPLAALIIKQIASALASKIANKVFEHYFPKEQEVDVKAEFAKLLKEIKKLFNEQEIKQLEDALIKTRAWLRDTYSQILASYNNGETVDLKDTYKLLREKQESLQDITSILSTRLNDNDFKTCDYLTRTKFTIYAATAALRVVVLREQLFFHEAIRKSGDKTFNNAALKNETETYIKDIKAFLTSGKDKLYNGRFGFIKPSGSTTERYQGSTYDPKTRRSTPYDYSVDYMTWSDSFKTEETDDDFRAYQDKRSKISYTPQNEESKNSKSNETEVRSKSDSEYNTHKNGVINLLNTYISNPVNDVITALA